MFPPRRWHRHWHRFQERLNLRLSAAEALVGLCLLGALTGLMAGAVNLAFRGAVELTQATFLDSEEAYEGLPWWARMGLPLLGGAAIWGYLRLAGGTDARTGVVYVIERTVYHQGYLGLRNAVTQFVAGAIAIISGHSVGREGPSVHLGATAGSLLGQRLRVPNNSMRTLVACGAAAAIGASFNTPLAGVAFAMEVVVMEYTIAGFLPVILAAGVATAMTHFFYGAAPAFSVPAIAAERLWELPVIALTGFAIGLLAALFNGGLTWTTRHTEDYPLALRLLAAGAAVGLIAVAVPEVMGIGYDTVGLALIGELAPLTLIAIAAAKLLATSVSLGLGIPAGLIGPTLVIGAAAGGAIGHGMEAALPWESSGTAYYALLGMGAMMGACLRAPLAALTAMLELTAAPGIIMPGMLVIVVATLTNSELFNQDSIFLAWLRAKGMDPRRNPLLFAFNRIGIARVMDRRVTVLPRVVEHERLDHVLEEEPRWILIEGEQPRKPIAVMPVTDLLQHAHEIPETETVDLLAIPAQRLQPAAIDLRATVREALETLRRERAEALYVTRTTVPGVRGYYGIVTRRDIENRYLG